MKYPTIYEAEWVEPIRKGWRLRCCDCGLVHILNFRTKKRHIQIQFFRDDRATGQARRKPQAAIVPR